MKGLPIPKRHSMLQSAPPEIRLKQLEDQMNAVIRNIETLSKPFVDARNLHPESLEMRHMSAELYGDTDDITNIRFGDAESAGTSLGPFAAADHKHAIDGVIILPKSEPTQIAATTNNWALDDDYSFYLIDSDAARSVTGIDDGTNGRLAILTNDGSFDITFVNQSASSDAENRIITGTGADVILGAGATAAFLYDSTASRWRLVWGWGI